MLFSFQIAIIPVICNKQCSIVNASIIHFDIHFDSVYNYGQFKDFKIEFENLRTQIEIEI